MTTLFSVELEVLGPLQVRHGGTSPVAIPGAKPRAILTMLGLHGGSVVSADALIELLWGDDPPRTADKALQTHISALRRALGDGFVLTQGSGWTANATKIDASDYKAIAKKARDAAAAGDVSQAVTHFDEALTLWRGVPELPDTQRGASEKTRWIEGHAALVEDRADALLATGRAAEIVGELEAAVAEAPLRERRWGQLMLALYRAGRQGDALAAYQRARTILADELGVDPGPNLRRLENAIVSQAASLDNPVTQQFSTLMRAVTFLLTDIEGSTAAWEADAEAMAAALARHDELVEQVVTSRGGRLIKTRGEGDATFSVFERPSAAAAAAVELQDAIGREPWALAQPMRIRIALHTGEVELRDGDYFGRAVNRAARLRSLGTGGQILCSGATAELVIDSLADDVVLADLGMRQLKNLARPEHVFELRLETAEVPEHETVEAPIQRPSLPSVLTGPGPFVGRGDELGRLLSAWNSALGGGVRAVLIAGEPGVGKTRLAGEWSRQAYEQGAVVLYGRCDEDLGAPYQPFAEALRTLVPCLGADRLRGMRGVEALLPLIPGLTDVVPDVAAPTRADPDTERYALFDAVVALLEVASVSAPVVLILDDLHWAAKSTLLLLRHLLRFGENGRVQIIGTYRSTDLDRSHPLAAMLADLHRDGTANRLQLSGLDEHDVTAYVAEAGYDDEELARALASVTGGNPFFLIEALRHVDESGGVWNPSTLPQGVREAVSRRLSRLPAETNKALAAAAVVGSRFAIDLVEHVVDEDLVDAFDDACKAGIIVEEPGGYYRFNHALVRQSLLAELPSVRRMRLHQRIATTLETQRGADDELLAELAHHYFECAWAGNAAKAVEYCRRAADQAMARLAYEGAADLYDRALHALEELDDELADRDDQVVELLVARCEALLAAGDVASAAGAVSQLQEAAHDSARLAAWATCFDSELSMLTHPERLDDIEAAVGAAASKLAELDDAAGEAKAHTVRAQCLARLGRVADCETALDDALTAARRAREHRRVNAVLASAPLAALWGPNPVPRAGGRCLDVVRLLRITTDSPAVEATSTRCQAVLEAFRGRAEAARRMIDTARRTVTELGLRHAMLEVEQFAGIVELVVDDPVAAEPHLRKAYNGFRRMGIDADTAETAALLGRACLALGRDADADELCSESERLAGHALAPAIAWRMLRAQLLSYRGDHKEARWNAEAAVALAERTDALVHHGDTCLALATVLDAAGDTAGARAAAERAAELYERKGAAALAEKARGIVGERGQPTPPAPPEAPSVELENACVRALVQLHSAVDREAWDELEHLLASDISVRSHRKVVGFSLVTLGPEEWTREAKRLHELGFVRHHHLVVAVRGERLALTRTQVNTADASAGAPQDELLQLIALDNDGRIAIDVYFDIDDIDIAMAELDAQHARFEQERPARRLENECARVIRRGEDAIYRQAWDEFEQLLSAQGVVESRRKITGGFTRNDYSASEARRLVENGGLRIRMPVIAVRGERLALTRLEIGTADVTPGAARDEMLAVMGLDENGRIALQVIFDGDDIEAAIAELDATYATFEAQHPQRRELENAASQAYERLLAYFSAGNWNAMAEMAAENVSLEDRRRMVNAGTLHGLDDTIEGARATASVGFTLAMLGVVATRGGRLALVRVRASGQDSEAVQNDAPVIVELDTEGRIAAVVVFDLEDIDAAFAELDARYLAGEAAPYARTWSVIAGCYAAVSRQELPPMTPDVVSIDHRRGKNFAPGELLEYLRAGRDLEEAIRNDVEVVHRLSDLGAVCTYAAHGLSQEGFAADWREVAVSTVEGGMVNRCELFDEVDLAAAIARFDELNRPAPRLENAASRVALRFLAQFAACDWDAIAELLTDDFSNDDRRRVVGASMQHGRNATIDDLRAIADLWSTAVSSTVIAVRGERLALMRFSFSDRQGSQAFISDVVGIAEITADERIAAFVAFGADELDAALAELDARYLAGDAAPHAHTWSVIAGAFAALNRGELPATTQDWVNIDHRHGIAVPPGDVMAYLRTALLDRVSRIYVESVPRLSSLGAVVRWVGHGTSQEGFDAEWRGADLFTVEGDLVNRAELFDEADVDAALARFDELSRPTRRLENTASRTVQRYLAHFAAREWDALSEVVAENIANDDRRRVVNAGKRHGRESEIASLRASADAGFTYMTSVVIALRGERLALLRVSGHDQSPDEFVNPTLGVVETNSDNQIAAIVVFDADDIDAAFEELDARYLAGEAAAHRDTWSVIAQAYAAFKRHELPAATADCVTVDHRHLATFEPGDLSAYLRAAWQDLGPEASVYIETVHRLNSLGAVVTHAGHGVSHGGVDAEWRMIDLLTVDGDLISRCELFDEADLDAAIARFEELQPTPRRLDNDASHVIERYLSHFISREWDAMAEMLTDDTVMDDRRRVVNAGALHGRDQHVANIRAFVGVGFERITPTIVATRGSRLALVDARISNRDLPADEVLSDMLCIIEIGPDSRILAVVVFDPDNIDAAFTELDARYLAGEGAPHAHTWSIIAGAYAAINRLEIPRIAPDWVSIDHRGETAFGADELFAYLRVGRDTDQHTNTYIEGVHRLNSRGAVITYAARETSQEGFDAEWRGVTLLTVDGEMVNRTEVFDEADLDTAIARFEELRPTSPQLQSRASELVDRMGAYYAAREWDALRNLFAEDYYCDDRRRVVNAGVRQGQDAAIEDLRSAADVGFSTDVTLKVIATRGDHLLLTLWCGSGRESEAVQVDVLQVVEYADERTTSAVLFDPEDIDVAFAELDARYVAGEAAPHAHTWSVIAATFQALNRREFPARTPDWVNIDHRRGVAVAPGDVSAYIQAAWKDADFSICAETVHELSDFGAVVTWVGHATSEEGFAAEWRGINIFGVRGDRISRTEIFDEEDLDAALARFDELCRPAPRLGNAASQATERFLERFAARDWETMAQMVTSDISSEDRRRGITAELQIGRDLFIRNYWTAADLGVSQTSNVVATRGDCLVLTRAKFSRSDGAPEEFGLDLLHVIEIDADDRLAAAVTFETNDFDAAIAELDARYLAGEAAPHADAWSATTTAFAALNRHEIPPVTADYVIVDHQLQHTTIAAGGLAEYMRASWGLTPDFRIYIEAVHKLTDFGTVITLAMHGTSSTGFDADWRIIEILTVEGNLGNRCEVFYENDLDAALARFEQLHPQSPRLENAASRVYERFLAHFAARDWGVMAELLADNSFTDDRRRIVNGGIRRRREVAIADMRALAELGVMNLTSEVIGVRGEHLALTRVGSSAFQTEVLNVVEIDAETRISAVVGLDPDDIDAAFEELESRYLAREAAAHVRAWSAIVRVQAAFNRHELPAIAMFSADHRPLVTIDAGDPQANIHAIWDLTPDLKGYTEAVHRLSGAGAVFTWVAHGMSRAGSGVEWRVVLLMMVEGDQIIRSEVFDEADLDAALTKFAELQPQPRRLANAAIRIGERVLAAFEARDWAAMAETLAVDVTVEDHRRVVNSGQTHGRDLFIDGFRAAADVGLTNVAWTPIATRGERLALWRVSMGGSDQSEGFHLEFLTIVEIDSDERILARVAFDADDIDAAFQELDARYIAGEAAPHAHVWSVIASAYAALKRRELPPTTPDWTSGDHRRFATIEPNTLTSSIRSVWGLMPDWSIYIEAVHRLSSRGAVVTHMSHAKSQEGLAIESCEAIVLSVSGDWISNCEIFDEADLDAALARSDELHRQATRLENAASQADEKFWTHFAARDWDATAKIAAEDICTDDRRRVVNAGLRQGRDAFMAEVFALVEVGVENVTTNVIATRGERLVLSRVGLSVRRDRESETFLAEVLCLVQIDGGGRIAARVLFDVDDIDAAFEELDARYLAGDAATYAHTWSVVVEANAGFNKASSPRSRKIG